MSFPGRSRRRWPRALRDFLRATLPDYMVPSAFVVLAQLPVVAQRQGGSVPDCRPRHASPKDSSRISAPARPSKPGWPACSPTCSGAARSVSTTISSSWGSLAPGDAGRLTRPAGAGHRAATDQHLREADGGGAGREGRGHRQGRRARAPLADAPAAAPGHFPASVVAAIHLGSRAALSRQDELQCQPGLSPARSSFAGRPS